MVIRKSAVEGLPENARKYVEEFFAEARILGIECMVAQRHAYHPSPSSYARWGKGTAPSHMVDLARFGKDERGRDVGQVLRDAEKESPDDFFTAYVTQRSCSSDCDD